jgi:hypothetical protein
MSAPSDHKLTRQGSLQQLNYIQGSSHKVLDFQNANSRRYAVMDENGHASGTKWEWWSRENRKGAYLRRLVYTSSLSLTSIALRSTYPPPESRTGTLAH